MIIMGNESIFTVKLYIPQAGTTEIAIGICQGQGARPYQEDSFGFSGIDKASIEANKGFTSVVADGMGGLSQSNLVSTMLVDFFVRTRFDADSHTPMYDQFRECVKSVSRDSSNSGGGSTLIVAHCCEKGVYWCSVGDSRIYLCTKGKLFQVTEDMDYRRNLLSEVIDDELEYEDADENPKASALTGYIGMPEVPVPECSTIPFIPANGDKLILCSDGVYNALSAEEMKTALGQSAQTAADTIRDMVIGKNYPNQDNFTAVILEFLN